VDIREIRVPTGSVNPQWVTGSILDPRTVLDDEALSAALQATTG